MTPTSPTSVVTEDNISKINAEHGQQLGSPEALKQAGNDAVRAGDFKRASHMFTLAIDMIVAETTPKNAGEWFALDAKSDGLLHLLLANRSLMHLNLKDAAAAAEDAEHCCLARPDWAKGHLRLLAALAAGDAPLDERRTACARGVRACPNAQQLFDAQDELDREAGVSNKTKGDVSDDIASQLAATRLIADDPNDPRRFMAAGDYGSNLAVGANGLDKDTAMAELYLKRGAEGGDAGAQRNYGHLLLESGRHAEGSAMLLQAANQGDEEAIAVLTQLGDEAAKKQKEMMFKLEALATNGDKRAIEMLKQLAESS